MTRLNIFSVLTILSTLFAIIYANRVCHCPRRSAGNPVCGSDDLTYDSKGELDCYNECENRRVLVKHYGACRCPCATTLEYLPVCTNDGETYPNNGTVRCHNQCYRRKIQIVKLGNCRGNY